MSDKKLLPCPFCGGKAFIRQNKDAMKTYRAYCGNEGCPISPNVSAYGKEMVIKLWNTRKPMEKIVERLEECYDKKHEGYMISRDLIDLGKKYGLEEAIESVKEEGGLNE